MNTPARIVDMDKDGREVEVSLEQTGVAEAEISRQIATAKRYPRSVARFRKELIEHVTLSQEIAGSCVYALPRAGKKIEGPSIRFAEIAMGCWGNCRATARVVAELDNFIVTQGIFIDLERNVAVGIEVNRRILDKDGNRFNVDMIGVTGAAASSIALRNAIMRGIPRSLTDEAYTAAKRTIAGNLSTLQDRRNRMLEAFKPYNVTEAQIIAAIGKQGLSEIGIDELVTLAGFLTAIQEGEKDPEQIFAPVEAKGARRSAPPPVQQQQTSSPGGGGSAGADAPKADGATGGEPDAPPAETAAADDDAPPTELESTVANSLIDCRTLADVDAVAKMFADDIRAADFQEQQEILRQLTNVREAMVNRGDLFPGDRQ